MEYDERVIEIRVRHSAEEPWTVRMSLGGGVMAVTPPMVQREVLERALSMVLKEALDRLFDDGRQVPV